MSATVSAPLSASCAASATPMPAPWHAIPRVTPGSQRRRGAGSLRTGRSSTRATFIWRRTPRTCRSSISDFSRRSTRTTSRAWDSTATLTGPFAVTRGAHNLRSEQVDYKRDEFRATITQFFDIGGTNHQLKGGFGYEEGSEIIDRHSNGWGTLVIDQRRYSGDVLHRTAGASLSREDLQSVRSGRHQHRFQTGSQCRRPAES